MFVFNGVAIFVGIWHKYIYDFIQRLTNCDNAIVAELLIYLVGYLPIFGNSVIVFYTWPVITAFYLFNTNMSFFSQFCFEYRHTAELLRLKFFFLYFTTITLTKIN